MRINLVGCQVGWVILIFISLCQILIGQNSLMDSFFLIVRHRFDYFGRVSGNDDVDRDVKILFDHRAGGDHDMILAGYAGHQDRSHAD